MASSIQQITKEGAGRLQSFPHEGDRFPNSNFKVHAQLSPTLPKQNQTLFQCQIIIRILIIYK